MSKNFGELGHLLSSLSGCKREMHVDKVEGYSG